jgi:hypothetical protein
LKYQDGMIGVKRGIIVKGEHPMNIRIAQKPLSNIIIALFWISPIMALNIRNTTEKTRRVTVSSADKKTQLGTVQVPSHKNALINMPDKPALSQIHVSIDSLMPDREELVVIGKYADLKGHWVRMGYDNQNRPLVVDMAPWLTPKVKVKIPADSKKSIYTIIDDLVTRIDIMANKADSYNEILTKAPYTPSIDPKSYLLITEIGHLSIKLYDPRVISASVIQAVKPAQAR